MANNLFELSQDPTPLGRGSIGRSARHDTGGEKPRGRYDH
jgi:hypothetical protein